MEGTPDYVRLDGVAMTLVFAIVKGGAADCIYLGSPLPDGEDLAALAMASARGRHESQPDVPPVPGLLPECKGGWSGSPAIEITRAGVAIETDFRVETWSSGRGFIQVEYLDQRQSLTAKVTWNLCDEDVVDCALSLTNRSDAPLALDRIASLAVPVPARFTEVTTFSGRWAGEMREHRRAIAPDGFVRVSAIGKPGFGGGNWLVLHDPALGDVMAAHLEWSGDYDTRLECDVQGAGDGRAVLMMAAGWQRGEVVLEPGESFESCGAVLSYASDRDALAQTFHQNLRACVIPFNATKSPRKVHLNSWEALGFDLTEERLMQLADQAAALRVERFVLDDGWFGSRRNDRSSLGDWTVSPDIFPNGLDPLIRHVHNLGMDFGLWTEPEMVSPDSDLYRKHPEWCIHINGLDRSTMRNQLVLDLTNAQAAKWLYVTIYDLISQHDIAYLKWDHNRDLFPRAGRNRVQTEALYGILRELNRVFPKLEIETCSSGGGRIDTQILTYTHRAWPSDNNDPIERLRIMQSWSQFLPLEVLGNHVGPSSNPITGRATAMDFRAKVALFGHMGVEADPGAMSEDERTVLAAHIALYKEWRAVLHSGELYRLDHRDPGVYAQMVVDEAKALALAAQTGFGRDFDAQPLRLKGLDRDATYRVHLPTPWPAKATLYLRDWQKWREGFELSGAALMAQGLALPLTHPETAWAIALEKVNR